MGVARVDITPDYPIRLNGFLGRKNESRGVRQSIWAKALAIGSGDEQPVVLITTDCLGVPDELVQQVAARLKDNAGLDPARLAVTATHTHSAPLIGGVSPNIFGEPIPDDALKTIDRYTREFAGKLEQVALAALKDRQPAKLSWGIGKAGFAVNRRTKGGPVDHDLPVLAVHDLDGKLRAVYVSYACHCVTLSDELISGDWAGYAQEHIERQHAGAVALISVGCGADSNPSSGVTGSRAEVASQQGLEIAAAAEKVLNGKLQPLSGPLVVKTERIDLALEKHPTRAAFEATAKQAEAAGYNARVQLGRLDRGEALRTKISYPMASWMFGDGLAVVFLPGEVVVDYSLRLKRELDGRRLWINAYANAAPCYIPSERILREGGYEGADAMVYYDQPAKFAPGLEQQIVDVVKGQLGASFAAVPADVATPPKVRVTPPLSPQDSRAALRTDPGLTVDLVVAEPLIESPVAIDFGPDGKLWVAEMYDYPLGLDGKFQPGGRVRLIESTRGDGTFDKSTVFLEGIPFPTGITVWRKGVLVCAAPDILYAEDTNGDGKADVVKKLFSGFGTDNYQARVNSLEYGLDGWVHGSCGLFGGRIRSVLADGKPVEVALGDRDFRIQPDGGLLEPATGRTQQGRPRDDWGNWFGCDNGTFCRHYPLEDRYLRRNPHFAAPESGVFVPDGPEANRFYPAKSDLQLFKLSGPPGQATAACGLGIYRDELLGDAYRGNAFTCEPVGLVVHRLELGPKGSSFAGRRPANERASEFLASTDNWFRPVQARTGPDGALWIVDMYRFVIEHPRWIPPEDLAGLDVRAGHDKGRIYRVRPADKPPREWPRLDRLDTPGLVAALDSPNGWQRDLAMQLLVWRNDMRAVRALEALAARSSRPEARLQALCTLDALGGLRPELAFDVLRDKHPGVRRHAVRLLEPHLNRERGLGPAVLRHVDDADAQVRLQVACSLGAWSDPRAGRALARLATRAAGDSFLTAAVLSSVSPENVADVVAGLLDYSAKDSPPEPFTQQLLSIAAAAGKPEDTARVLNVVITAHDGGYARWQWSALAGVLEALDRRGAALETAVDDNARERMAAMLERARAGALDASVLEDDRVAFIGILGREKGGRDADLERLAKLLTPQESARIQSAAAAALGRVGDERAADLLCAGWGAHSPAVKSQALDLLLGQAAWRQRLLAAIEAREIPAADVDLVRRQRLLASKDDALRSLAAKVFAGSINPDRQKVLDGHRDVLSLPGNRDRGRQLFVKSCAVCHRLEGTGHAIGPDLSAHANKTPQFLLQEILDPNRNVDSRYVAYTALSKAGRSVNGLLAAETATSITLLGQEGKRDVLLRADLDELISSGKSLMPEGVEKDLDRQQLADIIAFLTAGAPPRKEFAGNAPAVIKSVNGALALLATNGEIYGNEIAFETPFRNVGYWHGIHDHVAWTVALDAPAEFDVWLDAACDDAVAGNAFLLEGGEPTIRGQMAGTGGWDRYRQRKIGAMSLAAGVQRLVLRVDGDDLTGALMDLRGVHLVPRGRQPVIADAAFVETVDPNDVVAVGRAILDDARPEADRERLVRDNLSRAAELVTAMTADLKPDPKEEYRRVPWIWRVAIAAGRKNDTETLRKLLDASLPRPGEPLRDWQAVVVGGGIINGLSLEKVWPRERLAELVKDDPALEKRWNQALSQSAEMTENEKVPTGTRYDALRVIALAGWERRGEQLARYLKKGTHDELQMGAISGLSDIDGPQVAGLLVAGIGHFSSENRRLALEALLRTPARTRILIEALEAGRVKPAELGEGHVKALRELKDEKLRARAAKVLP